VSQLGAIEMGAIQVAWPVDAGIHEVRAGLDISVAPGSFVAIVGPSGCGKSTILRILAGLVVPDGGAATVDGVDVIGQPGRCAWMPQRDALLPWRRVLANAVLGAEIAGVDAEESTRHARALLGRFGLGEHEQSWPSELSGGMRQRLAVLRTFLTPAAVLLLDEPLGALDALTRRRMQAWLQEVWADAEGQAGDARRTVLMVTHDVEEALLLADRVLVLSARPAEVVADVEVAFGRPRDGALVADPSFVELRARLLAALGV